MNSDNCFEKWTLASCEAPDQACEDELLREWQVRLRCFDRWVSDGRLNQTDARDRLNRLGRAIALLRHYRVVTSSGDMTPGNA